MAEGNTLGVCQRTQLFLHIAPGVNLNNTLTLLPLFSCYCPILLVIQLAPKINSYVELVQILPEKNKTRSRWAFHCLYHSEEFAPWAWAHHGAKAWNEKTSKWTQQPHNTTTQHNNHTRTTTTRRCRRKRKDNGDWCCFTAVLIGEWVIISGSNCFFWCGKYDTLKEETWNPLKINFAGIHPVSLTRSV